MLLHMHPQLHMHRVTSWCHACHGAWCTLCIPLLSSFAALANCYYPHFALFWNSSGRRYTCNSASISCKAANRECAGKRKVLLPVSSLSATSQEAMVEQAVDDLGPVLQKPNIAKVICCGMSFHKAMNYPARKKADAHVDVHHLITQPWMTHMNLWQWFCIKINNPYLSIQK